VLARRSGLLSLAIVSGGRKEIFRVDRQKHMVYDLVADPRERTPLKPTDTSEKAPIMGWMRTVFDGLASSDEVPVQPLDEESVSALKSLGYVD